MQYSCQIRQPAIFEPDDIGKSYIPQKKALNRGPLLPGSKMAGFLSLMRILGYDWKTFLSVSFFRLVQIIPQNINKSTMNIFGFICCEVLIIKHLLVYEFL